MARKNKPKTKPEEPSKKTFLATFWFATILGFLGVDRFYLGYNITGVIKLLTIGGLGVWTIFDAVYTLTGKRRDSSGKLLSGYKENVPSIYWGLLAAAAITVFQVAAKWTDVSSTLATDTSSSVASEVIAIFILAGFIFGILIFSGFNIVDAVRRQLFGWAIINILVSLFGFSVLTFYYYFFVRSKDNKTAVI